MDKLPRSNQPCVAYRIDREYDDPEIIELATAGPWVEYGAELALLKKQLRLGKAIYRDREPVISRVKGRTLCAKRVEAPLEQRNPLFRMLNRMHRWLNDMVLLPSEERPSIVAPYLWAPRVMIELPTELAQRVTALSDYEHTDCLRDQARHNWPGW